MKRSVTAARLSSPQSGGPWWPARGRPLATMVCRRPMQLSSSKWIRRSRCGDNIGRRLLAVKSIFISNSAWGAQTAIVRETRVGRLASRGTAMINKYVAMGLGALIALAPVAAVAQEQVAQAAPAPAAAPAKATGTHGMQRRSARRTTRHQRRHTRRTGQPAPAATAAPKS
jgi:hypothetical protein